MDITMKRKKTNNGEYKHRLYFNLGNLRDNREETYIEKGIVKRT